MQLDAIAGKLTFGWADLCIGKTFKFYSSHEIDGVEIMQDIRAKWIELNADEIFGNSIPAMVADGFVLLDVHKKMKKEVESLEYDIYGEFESPVQLWQRDKDANILMYGINFTPKPRAIGSSALMLGFGGNNYKAIKKEFTPKQLIHCEFGNNNYGLGIPLLEGTWDSIMKLALSSHQDMLDKRTVPTLHLTTDDYSTDQVKAKGMLKMVANSDADIARVWYHDIDKGTGVVSDYPKFAQESPTSNPQYNSSRNKAEGISTGDFGNVDKEWGRLTTKTGHSINWFMGNRAGAVVGSETDKLNDDEQEIIDFKKVECIIRKLLDKFVQLGLMTMPKEPFVIKYWKDWERIELAEKQKADLEAQQDKVWERTGTDDSGKKVEIDAQDNEMDPKKNQEWKQNLGVFASLHSAKKENISHDMTFVWSSWIDMIGYDANTDMLYMKVLSGQAYKKPAPLGEWSYIDWVDAGSLGGYFWDYLSQRDPPWQLTSIPAHLLDNIVDIQNSETVKVPIMDYELIDSLDTETKIKHLGHKVDWSMGTGTATKVKNMLQLLKLNANNHQVRVNTMTAQAFGNSIKENHPLLYDIGNGVIVEEYICPDAWKKAVNTTVPLGVYHNLLEDIPELPDEQIVGTAEIFGWDDERGEDFVKYNFDYDKIGAVFENLKEFDWLSPTLKENGTSDISTAYYCDIEIKWNEALGKPIRVQTNIDLISISFVPRGNCPGEVCSLTVIKNNAIEMQAYINSCLEDGMEKGLCLKNAYNEFKTKT
ncbi:hypothetical protein LCGC14_0889170 [marine sediment metagenome]|uniref:Uncharacterized protein n=1 Tax=marine sediment metagenome TaxID=412755 RepID=A0A0F9RJ14_9ZZZZ